MRTRPQQTSQYQALPSWAATARQESEIGGECLDTVKVLMDGSAWTKGGMVGVSIFLHARAPGDSWISSRQAEREAWLHRTRRGPDGVTHSHVFRLPRPHRPLIVATEARAMEVTSTAC